MLYHGARKLVLVLNVFFLVRLSCLFPSMFNNFRCLSMGFTDKPDKWVCLKILWMEEILHQLIDGLSHYVCRISSIHCRYRDPYTPFHPLVNHPFPHKKLLSCFRVQVPSFNTRVHVDLIWDRGVVIFVHLINVGITIYEQTHIHNIYIYICVYIYMYIYIDTVISYIGSNDSSIFPTHLVFSPCLAPDPGAWRSARPYEAPSFYTSTS